MRFGITAFLASLALINSSIASAETIRTFSREIDPADDHVANQSRSPVVINECNAHGTSAWTKSAYHSLVTFVQVTAQFSDQATEAEIVVIGQHAVPPENYVDDFQLGPAIVAHIVSLKPEPPTGGLYFTQDGMEFRRESDE